MKIKLVNLAPLNEYGDYENDIQDLKDELAQLYRDQEETAEPEGGPIQNAIGAEIEAKQKEIEQAIGGSKQPKKDVPYDVAIGKMTQDEYDKHMLHVKYPKYYGPGGVKRFSTVKPDRDSFEKNSQFEGMKIGKNAYKTRTAVVTAPGVTEDKEVTIYNIDDLNNITIGWKGANHHGNRSYDNLKFTRESEGDDDLFAFSNARMYKKKGEEQVEPAGTWVFIVDLDEETGEPDWDTLMVDNRELENVADDGTSTYSLPDEDMINEGKELDSYQKSIAAKWDQESTKLGGGLFDTSRELEKTDTKQFNINVNNKKEYLTDLNNAGKLKKTYSDDQIENWTINPSITGSTIASKVKPKTKLKESYSSMYEQIIVETLVVTSEDGVEVQITDPRDIEDFLNDRGTVYGEDQDGGSVEVNINSALDYKNSANEGSCGTKSKPTDESTLNMMREVIKKEIKKLSEEGSLEDKLKGAFSPEEMDKINSKQVPSFADMKPKEKKSKFKKAGEKSGFDMRGLK